jgi:hypothetical protein
MAASKKKKTTGGVKAKSEPLVAPTGEGQDDDDSAYGAAAVLANADLLERVLSFLPKPAQVRCCAAVNRTFRDACKAETLWKVRAALLPTVVLSGATSGHGELLLGRTRMHVEKLLVRAPQDACFSISFILFPFFCFPPESPPSFSCW